MKKGLLIAMFIVCAVFFISPSQAASYSRHGKYMYPHSYYTGAVPYYYRNYHNCHRNYYPPMSYLQSRRYYDYYRPAPPAPRNVVNVNFSKNMPKNGHSNVNVFVSM